ncbi:MAG: hypothetical protein KTR14_09165 [Vampirovibrio sp.]|nr:hypothetical protein [Vampirovibrio sp.]
MSSTYESTANSQITTWYPAADATQSAETTLVDDTAEVENAFEAFDGDTEKLEDPMKDVADDVIEQQENSRRRTYKQKVMLHSKMDQLDRDYGDKKEKAQELYAKLWSATSVHEKNQIEDELHTVQYKMNIEFSEWMTLLNSVSRL